jgi:asparaginyl-tRNA synthetase
MEKQFAPWTFFSGIGNCGGSQREERFDVLVENESIRIDEEELWWYDTIWLSSSFRFGLGFERLVLFVTGMTNIRDVIPFQEHH